MSREAKIKLFTMEFIGNLHRIGFATLNSVTTSNNAATDNSSSEGVTERSFSLRLGQCLEQSGLVL